MIYIKNKIKNENKKEKKEKNEKDEEDLLIQKLLMEEFPKKCQEENKFIRISKYEYLFGEEKIKVALDGEEVILKLDEGDYPLQEFIEILNDEKEEEENENEEINKEEINENEEINEEEEKINNDYIEEKNEYFDKKEIIYNDSSEKKIKEKEEKKE